MAYTITSESYERKLPKVTIEADSLDDIANLTDFEEGSTAVVGGTTYTLDSASGWIVPGSGGGSGGVMFIGIPGTTMTATWQKVKDALEAGTLMFYVTYNGSSHGLVQVVWLITAAYQGQDGYYISGVSAAENEGAVGGPALFAETADGVLDTL